MTTDLPPLPDGPPVPGVIYTPQEAVAWIRTMTPEALVKASRVDPERFPRTKPGREVGFSSENIFAIVAATTGPMQANASKHAGTRRHRRLRTVAEVEPSAGGAPLVAKPQSARRRSRKAS